MKARNIWSVSLSIPVLAEEPVTAAFEHALGIVPSVFHNLRTGRTTVTAYGETPATSQRQQLARLRESLQALMAEQLVPRSSRLRVRRVPREDWAESWKRHFRPLEFGNRLLVQPGWSRRKPKAGQAPALPHPGLSFGTGQHATTSFCLRVLVRRNQPGPVLDIGTGSGILAIAAAKLGHTPVEAFDFDPDAVRIARENARHNRVRIKLWQQDLMSLPVRTDQRYATVFANLTADLLVGGAQRIIARVAPGGVLVLAGILESQFAGVRRCYEAAGLKLIRSRREREWRSGLFVRI